MNVDWKKAAYAAGFLAGARIRVLSDLCLPRHVLVIHNDEIERGRRQGAKAVRDHMMGRCSNFDDMVMGYKAQLPMTA